MYCAQEDIYGCAIAAVANVCQISYAESKYFFEPYYATSRGYYCRDIIRAFEQIGYQYKFTSERKYHGNFPYGTIVYVRSDDIPAGHYLARVDSGWVDSWINMLEPGNLNVKVGIRKSLPGRIIWVIYQA